MADQDLSDNDNALVLEGWELKITGPVGILGGWAEQYHRMRRSYNRLIDLAEGRMFATSDEARDVVFHFFQDAYHLKDWIKNDGVGSALRRAVEHELFCNGVPSPRCPGHGLAPLAMRLCADLCNGTKHLDLRNGRVGGAFTRQHVTVRPSAASSSQSPLHAWTIEGGGQERDAVDLAGEVIETWDQWLGGHALKPATRG